MRPGPSNGVAIGGEVDDLTDKPRNRMEECTTWPVKWGGGVALGGEMDLIHMPWNRVEG